MSICKPAIDNSREVHEMGKTCEMRQMCMGYFVLFMLFHETDFPLVSRGRSGNYTRDKRNFFAR